MTSQIPVQEYAYRVEKKKKVLSDLTNSMSHSDFSEATEKQNFSLLVKIGTRAQIVPKEILSKMESFCENFEIFSKMPILVRISYSKF